MPERKFIIVSNRLPFNKTIEQDGAVRWEKSAGGLITGLEPVLYRTGGIWLGWDGIPSEDPGACAPQVMDVKNVCPGNDEKRGSYKIACVPLSEEEYEAYYNRFSNGTLWGLFHYFFEKSHVDYASWRTYLDVNRRFAEYIAEVSDEKDLVWVQDFHLFMVPFFLRRMRKKQEIHFFLHIPFPHHDIFSILPWQRQILESLLCCNTVGFHHKQYLRNFLGAAEVYKKEKKAFGGSSAGEDVRTHFYANPISIDFERIDRRAKDPSVAGRREEIRTQAAAQKIIIGVDRIDYSKGIKERMLGLEFLLEEHPELQEKFFYYQLVVPSREDLKTYRDLKKEIDEIVGRMNGRFAKGLWTPVHYNYGTVPFDELVALYSAADIALVTPLRDGMNLVCKEYIAAHPDNDGVLVLSKFAGAISEIKNCLPVNPYSIEDIAGAIFRAMHMPEPERRLRMKKMRKNIKSNNIEMWFNNCLTHFEISKTLGRGGGEL